MLPKTDEALLLLRLGFGLMMIVHGWAKVSGFSEMSSGFPDPLGFGSHASLSLAIVAEFVCSILVVGGVVMRLALVPLIINMLTVVFVVFANAPWKAKELGATYLVVYLVLFVAGPGRYSLDQLFFGKKDES